LPLPVIGRAGPFVRVESRTVQAAYRAPPTARRGLISPSYRRPL